MTRALPSWTSGLVPVDMDGAATRDAVARWPFVTRLASLAGYAAGLGRNPGVLVGALPAWVSGVWVT